MQFKHFGRICHTFDAHLSGVDKTVLLDSYVYEGSKGCNIRHNSREFHSYIEVFNGLDIVVKLKLLSGLARVTTRLAQLVKDIIDGRKTEISGNIIRGIDLCAKLSIAYKVFRSNLKVTCHLINDMICLRVNSRVVKRI